ncbi:MAG: molecular chaperone HtpG, partial [Chitinophagales bacterium]|nr:molecular chaperone HtpG [Chitinophagales bacterium]
PNVKKISSHISKKVADRLEELFKEDRAAFESKWDDIKIFIEYGMMSDEKFYERAQKFCLFKTVEQKYFTLEEFKEKIKPLQTDKNEKLVYLYCSDAVEQHSFLAASKERGYEILLMDHPIDSHFIGFIEQKLENSTFTRIDSEIIDKLIDKGDPLSSKLDKEQEDALRKIIVDSTADKEKFTVKFEALAVTDAPVIITRNEFMRRMKEMSATSGQNFYGEMKDHFELTVNANHPIIGKVLLEVDPAKQHQLIKQSVDLAMLSQNLLKGEELTEFVKRSLEVMNG